jgi:hypothetical protein
MMEWLAQYEPRELIGLAGTIGGVLFLIVMIVSTQWASVRRNELIAHQAEQELALKQQMLERGMSAEEIVQVLQAGNAKLGKKSKEFVSAKT